MTNTHRLKTENFVETDLAYTLSVFWDSKKRLILSELNRADAVTFGALRTLLHTSYAKMYKLYFGLIADGLISYTQAKKVSDVEISLTEKGKALLTTFSDCQYIDGNALAIAYTLTEYGTAKLADMHQFLKSMIPEMKQAVAVIKTMEANERVVCTESPSDLDPMWSSYLSVYDLSEKGKSYFAPVIQKMKLWGEANKTAQ